MLTTVSDTSPTAGSHPRDSRGLVQASLAAPEEISSAVLEAADLAVPTTAPMVLLSGAGLGRIAARTVAALGAGRSRVPVVPVGSVAEIGPAPAGALLLDLGGGDGGGIRVPGSVGPLADRLGLATRVAAGLVLLDRASGLQPEPPGRLVDRVAARLDHHAVQGTAGRIARRIGRTLPLFHGGGPVGAAVADHWKFQANRHGKVAAWAAATPDLRHDEVCSWGQHGDVTRQVFTGVFLRGGYEATGDAEQLDRYEDLLDEFVAAIEVVVAAGADPLADVCELAVLGEQVGLAIALGEGFDPDPAPGLEWRV